MVHFTCYDSPFGPFVIGHEDGYVVQIKQCCNVDSHCASTASDLAALQLQEYFEGTRRIFDFPIMLKGTSFQKAVWDCLLEIPYGEVRTYGQIAAQIGKPKASRAVGMACNKNPLWIVVPCHRVIGSKQNLTGYAGGLNLKRKLLELEQTK